MTDFSKLHITLPGVDIGNIDIGSLLDVNVDDLEESMRHQPTLYCTFGILARQAEVQVKDVKAKIDLLESQIKRDAYTAARINDKRLLKDELQQEYYLSPDYVKLLDSLRTTEHAAAVLATIEESFKQRYGMVQQIAKRRSNELAQLGQAP